MSKGRGPATPVGIGVSGTSGVNIVAKSPCGFAFLLAWVRPPLRGFSLRSMLCILCTQSVLKAPLFKKLFIFLRLRQCFWRLWGQSGEFLGPWEAQTEAVVITLNQKVVDKFFKGLHRGGGSLPGHSAAASCKPSPSSGGKALSPSCFFSNSRNYDLCRKWRLTTIYRYSLPHRLSNSLMTGVQDISMNLPPSWAVTSAEVVSNGIPCGVLQEMH